MSTTPHVPPPADDRVKVAHLVLGLLFLGVVGVWAVITLGLVTPERLTVLGPGLLIAAGVAGLTASLVAARRGSRDDHTGYDDHTAPYYDDPYDDLSRRGEDPTEEIR